MSKVFPNPASNYVNFELATDKYKKWNVVILNDLGKTIESLDVLNNEKTNIDMSNHPKGIYFYQATSNGKVIGSGKIMVQ